MSKGHLCNPFFERELEDNLWDESKISLQLQFLPLLYAKPHDLIFVSDFPENPDPRLISLEDPRLISSLESWGPSHKIKKWAEKKNITYDIPPLPLIQEINSKLFSFSQTIPLKTATLLHSAKEARLWIESFSGNKVLKTPFGLSGKGLFFPEKLSQEKLKALFSKYPILIGEPWVDRLFDFSTQWYIEKQEIIYLGATALENTAHGSYLASYLPFPQKYDWALKEHLHFVKPVLQKIREKGFFGNLGIDAFVYENNKLQPLVEMNGRKTMGYLALHLRHAPPFRLCYKKASFGLLPQRIQRQGKWIDFDRNLTIESL